MSSWFTLNESHIIKTIDGLFNYEIGSTLNRIAKSHLEEARKSLKRAKDPKKAEFWRNELISARDFFVHAKIFFLEAGNKIF